MYRHFSKKVGDDFICTAKSRRQQQLCNAGKIDQFDDCCQYMNEHSLRCNIGKLIRIDQETEDEDARI